MGGGGYFYPEKERETLSSSPTHFSEVTSQWFLFILIGGKNKNPEIYEQLFIYNPKTPLIPYGWEIYRKATREEIACLIQWSWQS